MKIIIFTALYPPVIGGLSSHADEFNEHLASDDVDITVFTCLLVEGTNPYEEVNQNLRIIRFPAFEIVPNYPIPKFWYYTFWKLYFGLFRENYDVVISRIRFFNTTLLAMIYAKTKRTKWIHIEHTSNFTILSSELKSYLAKLYDLTIGRLVFLLSNMNISISKAVQNFVYRFDNRHSPIIYRGLNLNEIDAIQPDHDFKNRFKDKIILTTAARLYKWKGIDDSIIAVKRLPDHIKRQIIFVIIGDGEDFSRLKELCDESIIMIGCIPREKVISVLKVSDIYIHSSLHGGGLSTSLLEAMYCNCTVIATPYEGANEVLVDNWNGYLIPQIAKDALNQIIEQLILKKELSKALGDNARRTIQEKFNWKDSIRKYRELLRYIARKV